MRHEPLLSSHLLPIVLVGIPGAGKTSVSRELARLVGVVEVDTDAEVRRRARTSIPEIFAKEGEEGFRKREHEAIRHVLANSNGVVSLGGGAVLHEGTRELLKDHLVINLIASPDSAARRIGSGKGRPLLDGDLVSQLSELSKQRQAFYEEVADINVQTDGLTLSEVAIRAFEALRHYGERNPTRPARVLPTESNAVAIPVIAQRPYRVLVGRSILNEVIGAIPKRATRALIFHPKALTDRANIVASLVTQASLQTTTFQVLDAEEQKTLEMAGKCFEAAAAARLSRQDVIINVGGGATTDLGGWIGASWLRGIAVIHVPTSLLAMVDAAVGGKTGINTRAGKNLVGAFWSPHGVICDLEMLDSLPETDMRAGLAEVIKCGFISDPTILELVVSHGGLSAQDPHSVVLAQLIQRAVKVKSSVVSNDLRENGLREILNYGHTFGHAIERMENYQMRHGQAVAIGMVYAAEVGYRIGTVNAELLQMHRDILTLIGLPTSYQGDWDQLFAYMGMDKKVRCDEIRMVILDRLGVARTRSITDISVLRDAADRVRE